MGVVPHSVVLGEAMKPQLIFSDDDQGLISNFCASFEGRPELTAIALKPSELRKADIDALYLSLPYAERWGARPILYKAQILKTRPEDKDMPPYVITGVAMPVSEPRDPRAELKLVIAAVLDAVEAFNLENADHPLKRIGLWTEMIGARRVPPAEAGSIIRTAYEEQYNGRVRDL